MYKKQAIQDVFLLIILAIIAYWPIPLCIFSLKNDSLIQFLPFRYHLSEAIQNGYYPFWSPFLYTGLPIHSDIQGEVWNPIVLLISFFTTYNMSVLQVEVTIYLVASALGMYKLLSVFKFPRFIKLIGALSYMCCGFITDSGSIIPWLGSAAFIPFCFAYLYQLILKPCLSNSIKLAISLSMLFLCGYPSFCIYTAYVIIAALIFAFFNRPKEQKIRRTKITILYLSAAVLFFLLLCGPAIISYWEFLPYYARGSAISAEKATENSFKLFSVISYIVPNAPYKPHPWLNTDPSARSAYLGIFIFLFFILSFSRKYTRLQFLILGITLFSFLFSLGNLTPLHVWSYHLLPLVNTFRHPATIRVFTSIGIILLSAWCIRDYCQNPDPSFKKKIVTGCFVSAALLSVLIIYYLFTGAIFRNIQSSLMPGGSAKARLDNISFATAVVIVSFVQLIFIGIFVALIKKKKSLLKLIFICGAANSILFAWIALPLTFISQQKTSTINNYLKTFPKGFPAPGISDPIRAGVISDSIFISPYGYQNFYDKKITIQDHIVTPTINNLYGEFLHSKELRIVLDAYPWVYLADTAILKEAFVKDPALYENKRIVLVDSNNRSYLNNFETSGTVNLRKFSVNSFGFEVNAEHPGLLNIFQQYNHNWKAVINGKPATILRTNIAFMSVSVPKGFSRIDLIYDPVAVVMAIKIALITILLIVIYSIAWLIKMRR